MHRLTIAAALAGAGVLVARALASRLHDRVIAGCERMFERMPDDFPPKRMMRGIEETRANTVRTLELLAQSERTGGQPQGGESPSEVPVIAAPTERR